MSSKNILITGSARGIGRVLARTLLLSPRNHIIYLLDINEAELKHTVNEHLQALKPPTQEHGIDTNPDSDRNTALNSRLGYAVVDLTSPTAVRSVIKEAATTFFPNRRIDVLVNNAGIPKPSWADGKTMEDESTLDEWNAYLAANLTAPFLVSQAVIPFMKSVQDRDGNGDSEKGGKGQGPEEGGSIIHISSHRAHHSSPNSEPYATTKAGLLGLTHSMAVSCSQFNIRVNAILPGRISVGHESAAADDANAETETEAVGRNATPNQHRTGGPPTTWQQQNLPQVQKSHPVNRTGRGEDIAQAVEYLMDAGFVSGVELLVDGGVGGRWGD